MWNQPIMYSTADIKFAYSVQYNLHRICLFCTVQLMWNLDILHSTTYVKSAYSAQYTVTICLSFTVQLTQDYGLGVWWKHEINHSSYSSYDWKRYFPPESSSSFMADSKLPDVLSRAAEICSDIRIPSFMAFNRPPPSPRRAGPRHSGRRINNLTTKLAFSSTLSPVI